LVLSLALHGAFLLSSELFAKPIAEIKQPAPDSDFVEFILPPPPLDEPDLVPVDDPGDNADDTPLVAPPRQAELLATVEVDVFTQKPQPPTTGITIDGTTLTIPATSTRPGRKTDGAPVLSLDMLDVQPSPRFQAKPVYPFEMRRAGITGEVVVAFIVDHRGNVRDATAIRSSQRDFEAAAVQAVGKWTFRPGRKNGQAVNTRMQVPVVFSITSE